MDTNRTLLKLMNLPPGRFAGVCRTTDGHYIAQIHGDVGYNAFLGRPAPPHDGPGRDSMLATWHSLTPRDKAAVISLAANPIDGEPIDLAADFGVPVEEPC